MTLISRTTIAATALLLCLGGSPPVRAQPTADPETPPSPLPPDPTIAPPSPDAPPAKVERAKEVAKKAKLTPIIPNPNDATKPAFQLYGEIDLPVLAIGVIFGTARFVRTQPAFCAPQCEPSQLNILDRKTAGFYSTKWQLASNVGIYGLVGASALYLLIDEGPLPALNDAVVVAESALSSTALLTMMTLAASRPRPFLFGDKAPLSERNSADAGLSFLSSHTSVSFAIATSLFMAERRLHPTSHRPAVILGVGLGVASFVGLSRVLAGRHFITDVIGGAIVGSSLGILIPSLHESPVQLVPIVGDNQHGVGISAIF